MGHIRYSLTVAGALIMMIGLLWVGHGMGLFRLPGTDFMTKESVWTINGSLVAIFGLVVLFATRRLLRDPDARQL